MSEAPVQRGEIILVEDYESDAEQLQRVLHQIGVTNPLRRLKDGGSAMSFLNVVRQGGNVPAVLLLDIKLPGFSGFDILKAIRGIKRFDPMLKIAFSTLEDAASIKQAYVLGAHSYLIKPVEVEDLNSIIESFPGLWLVDAAKTAFQPG
jgi:CheY-like chemotaxis protein